jgi:hypothetical protein
MGLDFEKDNRKCPPVTSFSGRKVGMARLRRPRRAVAAQLWAPVSRRHDCSVRWNADGDAEARRPYRKFAKTSLYKKKEAGHYSGLMRTTTNPFIIRLRRRSFTPYFTHDNLHFCIPMT